MWTKKGLIFNSNNNHNWMNNGAMIPCPIHLNNKTIRVFLTFLDKEGIGRTGYVDLKKDNLSEVINISKAPVFDIGKPGTFDENGSLTCGVLKMSDNKYHFYYAGFELGKKIRYRLLTGLCITNEKFQIIKKYNSPILERSEDELYFRGGPFCLLEDNIVKMWYVGGSGWTIINGKSMPVYDIRYLESSDGINFDKKGEVVIKIENENEHGFGRPYIVKHKGIYKMFYSIRVKEKGYRLGYAESVDGYEWVRKDELMNLDVSENDFDNEMICYSAVIEINNKLVMFYNGNNFGKSGLGYAIYE